MEYHLGQTFNSFEEFSKDFKKESEKNFCNWTTFGSGKRTDVKDLSNIMKKKQS